MTSKLFVSLALSLASFCCPETVFASPAIMKKHCSECHNDEKAKGKFNLRFLGGAPDAKNLDHWVEALDLVSAQEMPPEDESKLSAPDRAKLIEFLKQNIHRHNAGSEPTERTAPRRLNNREFANSVRDALLIEDIGTHQPAANLIGDSLHRGFDTHGETLGFSKFHLEQYIEAVRKVVDATILSGERPESRLYKISSDEIFAAHTKANTKRPERRGRREGFDFLDPKQLAYFEDFKTAPTTGRYKITIRCAGKDRNVYETRDTGIYSEDPIRMSVLMGDRERVFDLPDESVMEIKLDEWLAEGTRLRLHYPTDGLTLRGNGNFKFQNAIAGMHIKEHNPERYEEIVAGLKSTRTGRRIRSAESWHHWVDYWAGARPRVFDAVIEGPIYESWPPKRQIALIGRYPKADNAAAILKPIAERAWRRDVRAGELDRIAGLVQSKAKKVGDIEALKEGIVAILVSPAFLLINPAEVQPADRFAAKFSYFLQSTIPDAGLRRAAANNELNSFEAVRAEIQRRFDQSKADAFLRAFPHAWLELNDINFMAPDPDHYRFYHRKRVSEDMVDEALHFFRHAVENNIPVPEFLSADYSFINADLAEIYQAEGVPPDSRFRKHTFKDGRRGGLLGMSAFLTSTADSLSTSPIHRAIYVMENLLGIHPSPPPPDVKIEEPDVRQARTIKEILNAHKSDPNCASCHKSIDPFGFAFENFDPTGAWRDVYTVPTAPTADSAAEQVAAKRKKANKNTTIPIDAGARFRNDAEYRDITGYRKQLLTDANRDRFVRCFITKLLTYANGVEPGDADFAEVDKILTKSAERDYRTLDTIAAVVDSPLFRDR